MQIIKRTEANVGTARFSGFVVEGKNKLLEVRAALTNGLSEIGASVRSSKS